MNAVGGKSIEIVWARGLIEMSERPVSNCKPTRFFSDSLSTWAGKMDL
jgi:hypothetical protein